MSATDGIAVVGGGWAGSAAALTLAQAGRKVTLFEAQRTPGGRARAVEVHGHMLDNGQHIMLGAYRETLRLMRLAGLDARHALLKLPLQMRYPPGQGMDFAAPRLPAPLHLLGALLRARGLGREDKLALARFSSTARWMGWTLHTDCSVAELLDRFDQTARINRLMWHPLCLAALNTPPERASAQVFLNVLRDSLGARRAASDMLLPRTDLTSAFPAAALNVVQSRGGAVHCATRVDRVAPASGGGWQVDASGSAVGGALSAQYAGVVLAVPPGAAAALLDPLAAAVEAVAELAAQLRAFDYEPITTCYFQFPPAMRLARPFFALEDAPAHGHFAQFVFDRGHVDPGHAGLLAAVISCSADAAALPQEQLAASTAAQLAAAFGDPALAQPLWSRVITEKRATFACTPGLARPANATALPGLVLAGDHTASAYPATLEAAVRSGVEAAKLLAALR
ncbi:hydroxysqualene dehydroxylase HpnE [Pseudoduganella sp. GCM10020061]|uniref:hydroxysqualene dehydroxylase HpnE n=1 Tax=Pseudoduganella sp. GCM10020061 TaxID=3317345 RepID=UPI00362CBFFF